MRIRWGAGGRCFHFLSPLILIILFSGYNPFTQEKNQGFRLLSQLTWPSSHNLSGRARNTGLT